MSHNPNTYKIFGVSGHELDAYFGKRAAAAKSLASLIEINQCWLGKGIPIENGMVRIIQIVMPNYTITYCPLPTPMFIVTDYRYPKCFKSFLRMLDFILVNWD